MNTRIYAAPAVKGLSIYLPEFWKLNDKRGLADHMIVRGGGGGIMIMCHHVYFVEVCTSFYIILYTKLFFLLFTDFPLICYCVCKSSILKSLFFILLASERKLYNSYAQSGSDCK